MIWLGARAPPGAPILLASCHLKYSDTDDGGFIKRSCRPRIPGAEIWAPGDIVSGARRDASRARRLFQHIGNRIDACLGALFVLVPGRTAHANTANVLAVSGQDR